MFFGKEFNTEMKHGICIILMGSLVYSYFDLDFNYTGYMWMTLNTIIFAINVLYEKYAVVSVDQTAVGVSCYQNILSLPLLMIMLISTGDHAELIMPPSVDDDHPALVGLSVTIELTFEVSSVCLCARFKLDPSPLG